ncbi:MAG: DUF3618 domain-containing protein [Trueperella sp.]|nr:DUF3618 domain-containing protein [Trueperella sp.]
MSQINIRARMAAQAKTAADYELPADQPDDRSAAQIQQDIERVREEMTATVDELADILAPEALLNNAKATAAEKFDVVKDKLQELWCGARDGDVPSILALAGIALATRFVLRRIF